ncbi:magnesium transporter [Amphibacillus xylanus]|uniref:Magnesium transporter MgtE n=1 Tax=Amphibacillus xylanus (strain ATCC 51415 / DSM 6626 / JCM 7361 / LMG 17667 / NBRC 15112 / Ep01) TaxID=698758 RepID=K0IZD3_AMPXN|nr:magnesium transporter [Amphibacillus xylanus]BAM47910.1 magnesium transporter MgtE [Amphibacillus xylanus NBRC 15112]
MNNVTINAREKINDAIEAALINEDINQFRDEFLKIHPYDQSEFFEAQTEEVRYLIYSYLSPEEMADVIEHVEREKQSDFIVEMNPTYAAQVLANMATDDAVDLLNDLDKNKVASYLTIMPEDEADEIKDLLHYEEKTAGSIMTTEFVVVNTHMTVKEAMRHLRKAAPDAETIYYIYVVNDDQQLIGVISLRDLIIAEGDLTIDEVVNRQIVSVSVGDDQEDIARMMRDYDFLALPVVDFQNHLLGIITVDDIMDVMDEEASDDYSKLAGVDVDDVDQNPITAAKKRLPWLIILLILGLFTASIIARFEETLEQVALLAIFIPLIAGMAGNTGTQSLAVAVRGIATGEFQKHGIVKTIMRESITGMITGITCGLAIWLIIFIWQGTMFLGFLVGLSIAITLFVATISGALVPLLMNRLNIDPAVASGPFITTINDIISITIYFGMATMFMQFLL